jgi:hypothetical protein
MGKITTITLDSELQPLDILNSLASTIQFRHPFNLFKLHGIPRAQMMLFSSLFWLGNGHGCLSVFCSEGQNKLIRFFSRRTSRKILMAKSDENRVKIPRVSARTNLVLFAWQKAAIQ